MSTRMSGSGERWRWPWLWPPDSIGLRPSAVAALLAKLWKLWKLSPPSTPPPPPLPLPCVGDGADDGATGRIAAPDGAVDSGAVADSGGSDAVDLLLPTPTPTPAPLRRLPSVDTLAVDSIPGCDAARDSAWPTWTSCRLRSDVALHTSKQRTHTHAHTRR